MKIVGWKIGRVGPEFEERFGQARLAGPIFRRGLRHARANEPVAFPVFKGGFAAVEAEFVFVLANDAPAGKLSWTLDEARALIAAMHYRHRDGGKSSWRHQRARSGRRGQRFRKQCGTDPRTCRRGLESLPRDRADLRDLHRGRVGGQGCRSDLPGGPVEALRFLLEHCAQRGRPLKAGMLVSTGAATGIHEIAAGQRARVDFGALGAIECVAVVARPEGGSRG